jgi:hypothetical protein
VAAVGGNKRYPRDPAPDARRRHCWVLATANERGPWPGLILEWRRTPSDDWQARVVYVPNPRDTRTVEMWFAAGLLRPLEPPAPSRSSQETALYAAADGAPVLREAP